MFSVNDVKNGITFELEGEIFQVLEFSHVKPGKGAAFVKMKVRNLRTGSTTEKSFNSGTKLDKAMIEKKPMQFLYASGDSYNFMNMDSYEQMELTSAQLGDEAKFLKEGLTVEMMNFNGEIIGVTLPEKISYKVIETEMAVKGNTTSGAMKDAKIETGYTVKVPLFIEEGEEIIITTSDGKYSSRA